MIQIALCDDNPSDLERLLSLLNQYIQNNKLKVNISTFNHPDKLLQESTTKHYNLYLLDIVMPMVNGIQAAREIRWNDKNAQIIFVTSEKDFALESFEVNPINYLLKPITEDRLFQTLDLAFSRIKEEEAHYLTIKTKEGLRSFVAENILYIEYSNHIIKYVLSNGDEIKTVTQRISFEEYIAQNLPNISSLSRCHESFLVNLPFVEVLTKNTIEMRGSQIIPVSKSRYQDFQKAYLNFRLS